MTADDKTKTPSLLMLAAGTYRVRAAANRKFVSWASISQLDLNGFFAKRDGGEGGRQANGQVLAIHQQCEQCDEAFSTVNNLKKHRRTQQKGGVQKCSGNL